MRIVSMLLSRVLSRALSASRIGDCAFGRVEGIARPKAGREEERGTSACDYDIQLMLLDNDIVYR